VKPSTAWALLFSQAHWDSTSLSFPLYLNLVFGALIDVDAPSPMSISRAQPVCCLTAGNKPRQLNGCDCLYG
jgi:hypothetical protein